MLLLPHVPAAVLAKSKQNNYECMTSYKMKSRVLLSGL